MSKNQNTPKKPTTKRVFDVVPPGKAPASATSRPVIVSHKPQVQDDQLVKTPDSRLAANPNEERSLLDSHHKVNIAAPKDAEPAQAAAATLPPETAPAKPPVSDDLAQVATDLADSMSTDAVPNAPPTTNETPEETPTKQPTFEPPHGNAPDVSPEQTPAAIAVSQVVETDAKGEHDDASENENSNGLPADMEHTEPSHDDKPVGGGKVMNAEDIVAATNAPVIDRVVVSQHRTKAKTWEWLLVIFLVIVLAAIALDLLLDAKVINTSLNLPHTHFFKS